MKTPFPLPIFGVLLFLISPVSCLSNLLVGPHPEIALYGLVLRVVGTVVLILPLMLMVLWATRGKSFSWETASQAERKSFLQRQQTPRMKQLVQIVAFMLFASGGSAAFVYYSQLSWKPTTVPFPTYLSATLLSYFVASVVAFLWVLLCDHKLRATQTPTI